MSYTQSIGVVGAEYWSYMAKVMAGCLDQTIKGQKANVPLGILCDALLFFGVVLSRKTGNTMFDNLPARSHAHALAWEILRDCPGFRSRTPKETDGHFRRFADFLKSLANQPTVLLGEGWHRELTVPLGKRNHETAIDLRDFFAALLRKDARESRY